MSTAITIDPAQLGRQKQRARGRAVHHQDTDAAAVRGPPQAETRHGQRQQRRGHHAVSMKSTGEASTARTTGERSRGRQRRRCQIDAAHRDPQHGARGHQQQRDRHRQSGRRGQAPVTRRQSSSGPVASSSNTASKASSTPARRCRMRARAS